MNQLINECIDDLVDYQEGIEKLSPAASFFQEPVIFENQQCGGLPFAAIQLGQLTIPALLDSGSAFNMIREDVLKEEGISYDQHNSSFLCANGRSHFKGKVQLDFNVGSRSFSKIPFIVVESHPLQAILGYPALKKKSILSLTQISDETMTKKGTELPDRHQKLIEKLKPQSPCKVVDHQFELGELVNQDPFQEPMRVMNAERRNFLLKWIPTEIQNDLIEEGTLGDWISPLVLVTHYDKEKKPIPGDYRVCLDATKINKCFRKLPISMPLISDITAELSRYRYKAVIDLKWAFTHLPLSPSQRKFFGFATPIGSFRFKRAPFGFINSPANQQFFVVKKVDRPFKLKWKDLQRFIESYIDDIHLGAMTLMELLEMIYEVLEQLVRLNCSVVPTSI